jgi:cell shape-determining protein MreC
MLDSKMDALRLLEELRADLEKVIQLHNSYVQTATGGANSVSGGGSINQKQLMATKRMQETNQSSNLQYLQLQQKMQSVNRQITLLSNLMKTKHNMAMNMIRSMR